MSRTEAGSRGRVFFIGASLVGLLMLGFAAVFVASVACILLVFGGTSAVVEKWQGLRTPHDDAAFVIALILAASVGVGLGTWLWFQTVRFMGVGEREAQEMIRAPQSDVSLCDSTLGRFLRRLFRRVVR